jgi:hypothetical protein
MRWRAVIGATVVCAVAWGLALLTWPGQDSGRMVSIDGPAETRLVFDEAAVTEIVSEVDGLRTRAVRRATAAGAWVVEDDRGVWIGDEFAARSAIRELLTTGFRERVEDDLGRTSEGGMVTVETRDGTRHIVTFGAEPAGGFLRGELITVPDGPVPDWPNEVGSAAREPVLVPARVAELARAARAGGWRSPALLPRIEPGAGTLRIRGAGGAGVAVRRVGGRWVFAEGRSRVDQQRASELVARLSGLRAAGWIAEVEGEAAVTVELVTSRPDGTAWTQRLEIVGQADTAGERVAVRVSFESAGERWTVGAAVPARTLAGLPASEISLVDPVALGVPAADVVRVEIDGRTIEREAEAWRAGERVSHGEAAAVEALLEMLTTPASEVRAERPEGSWRAVRVWAIGDVEPRAFEVLEDGGRTVVWDGGTARVFAGGG